jgi:hypothetical protein
MAPKRLPNGDHLDHTQLKGQARRDYIKRANKATERRSQKQEMTGLAALQRKCLTTKFLPGDK